MAQPWKFGRLATVAFMGAVVATICDGVHAFTGALSYPEPAMGIQAWWVFPGFCVAFMAIMVLYRVLTQLLAGVTPVEKSTSPGNARAFVETLTYFALVYFASGVGNEYTTTLLIIFTVLFVVRLATTYEPMWLLILATLLAIGGIAVEGALAAFGLVTYRVEEIFYVPWWLGGLYLHGAFAVRESMRYIYYREDSTT